MFEALRASAVHGHAARALLVAALRELVRASGRSASDRWRAPTSRPPGAHRRCCGVRRTPAAGWTCCCSTCSTGELVWDEFEVARFDRHVPFGAASDRRGPTVRRDSCRSALHATYDVPGHRSGPSRRVVRGTGGATSREHSTRPAPARPDDDDAARRAPARGPVPHPVRGLSEPSAVPRLTDGPVIGPSSRSVHVSRARGRPRRPDRRARLLPGTGRSTLRPGARPPVVSHT